MGALSSSIKFARLQSTSASTSTITKHSDEVTQKPLKLTREQYKHATAERSKALRASIEQQISEKKTAKEILDTVLQSVQSSESSNLPRYISGIVLTDIMKHADKEAQDPNISYIPITPQDILNKGVYHQIASGVTFEYIAKKLIQEGDYNAVLALWVEYREYSLTINLHDDRFTFKNIVLLAYVESCVVNNTIPETEKILALLNMEKLPEKRNLIQLFPSNKERAASLRDGLDALYLTSKSPNSIGDIKAGFLAAKAGRVYEVEEILRNMRKVSKLTNTPMNESTLISFMEMFNILNRAQTSLDLWAELLGAGVKPSTAAWNALLEAVSKKGNPRQRLGQVEHVFRKIPEPNDETYAQYIRVLTKFKRFDLVESVVEGKLNKPVIVQAYVVSLAARNKWEDVSSILNDLKKKDIQLSKETYNSLLSSLVKNDKLKEAEELYDDMTSNNYKADVATYSILIDMALKSMLSRGEVPTSATIKSFFDGMKKDGIQANKVTYTSLMDALAKGGSLKTSQLVFEYLQKEKLASETSYMAIITSEFNHGKVAEGEQHFKEFLTNGYRPRPSNWSALFEGFCKNRNVDKSKEYLSAIEQTSNSSESLNKYSYYYLFRLANEERDASLAKQVFDVVEKFNSAQILSGPTLRVLKNMKRLLQVEIPESIEKRLDQ